MSKYKYMKPFHNEPSSDDIKEAIKEAEAFYKGSYHEHHLEEGFHDKKKIYLIDIRINKQPN